MASASTGAAGVATSSTGAAGASASAGAAAAASCSTVVEEAASPSAGAPPSEAGVSEGVPLDVNPRVVSGAAL